MRSVNKPKIFISHSWEDKPLVKSLEVDLKTAGLDIWVDHSETYGGDILPDRISEALEWCDTLLLVWSEAAENSRWVKLEWTNAIALGKSIIPCKLGTNKLPTILANYKYIDFHDYELGLNQLLSSLRLSDENKDELTKKMRDKSENQLISSTIIRQKAGNNAIQIGQVGRDINIEL